MNHILIVSLHHFYDNFYVSYEVKWSKKKWKYKSTERKRKREIEEEKTK